MAGVDEFLLDVVRRRRGSPRSVCSVSSTPGGGSRQFILSCERGPIFWAARAPGSPTISVCSLTTARDGTSASALGRGLSTVVGPFRATSKTHAGPHRWRAICPAPKASVDKIMIAAADQAVFDVARAICCAATWKPMTTARSRGVGAREWAYSRARHHLTGGTSEIQKDIVASRAARIAEKARD